MNSTISFPTEFYAFSVGDYHALSRFWNPTRKLHIKLKNNKTITGIIIMVIHYLGVKV